jgi:2-iminobutanoate/2-iminopropanoate deaminase
MQRQLFTVPGVGNPQWYSAATRFGDLIFSAGHLASTRDGDIPEGIAAQVSATFDNLEQSLQAAGGGLDTLLKINTYLASLDDFGAYNEVYVARLGPLGLPARTTVEVARLPPGFLIEIEAVAHAR